MKALLLIGLLITAVVVHGQVRQYTFDLDLSGGDTTIEITNIAGFIHASWQITVTGLDAADATFTLNKRNERAPFGAIPSATGTFASGSSVRFIEFADPFMNSAFQLVIVVNSVTAGILNIDVNLFRP